MAGFKIQFLTDTDGVRRGTKDIEKALEDVSDSLDDVTNDAEGAADRMEKSFRDLAQDTKKQARAMGDDIKGSYDKAAVDVGEATTQMSEDGFSNAKEVAASFDGSAESIVDGFQGAAAEMFSGFGPAGAAAGLAAAAGIGLVTAELEKQKERASEAAAAAWDLAQQMVDAGQYAVSEEFRVNLAREWLGDEDERKRAKQYIEDLGISTEEFAYGLFDVGGKREELEQRIRDTYSDQRSEIRELFTSYEGRQTAIENIDDAEQRVLDLLGEQDTMLMNAQESAKELNRLNVEAGILWDEQTYKIGDVEDRLDRMSAQDYTPTFDTAPWDTDIDRFIRRTQSKLNSLSLPGSVTRRVD